MSIDKAIYLIFIEIIFILDKILLILILKMIEYIKESSTRGMITKDLFK